jgi:hypothetical protein
MRKIKIIITNRNLEILTILMNSVARKYGCRVEYVSEENRLRFIGDRDCCRHITEETLALFKGSTGDVAIPLQCPASTGYGTG